MSMSEYYRELRGKAGGGLLMMPSVAAVVRDEQDRILLIRKRMRPYGACQPERLNLERPRPGRCAERCSKRPA